MRNRTILRTELRLRDGKEKEAEERWKAVQENLRAYYQLFESKLIKYRIDVDTKTGIGQMIECEQEEQSHEPPHSQPLQGE